MKSIALLDPRLPKVISENLRRYEIESIEVPLCDSVDVPIAGHPDIQLFLSGRSCFVHPEMPRSFIEELSQYFEVTTGDSFLRSKYPHDIAYNVAQVGGVAFHKKENTDPKIRKFFERNKIELIDVTQGYTKCSTVIVDRESIITSDMKIDRVARERGLNSLLISPGHVELPGYKYGFLGGATGQTDEYVFFTGTINHHPDKMDIMEFIRSRGKELVFLSQDKVIDGGSILIVSGY